MAAATADAARSAAKADSYIGSLISLTSKSEIRYEGVLCNINTEESSIGLRNVRSFGTEGRKKDGPQIPPSDKVYEYILFRGSDIKDLQVKSSLPAQPAPLSHIHNDPAIIQSHYPGPASTSMSVPSPGAGTMPDINSHTGQVGMPRVPFQGSLPLYQPGGSLGSWGSSPPNANGSGLGMPMYWQGFYPPGGPPHLQQPPLLRPPPGLSMPHPLQQPLQYTGINASLPPVPQSMSGKTSVVSSGLLNLQGPNAAASLGPSLPELPSLLPPLSGTPSSSSTMLPSTIAPNLSTTLSPEMPTTALQSKPLITSLPATTLLTSLPFVSATATNIESISTAESSRPRTTSVPSLSYQAISQPVPSITGKPSSSQGETSVPSLPTPGQLLQSGPSTSSTSLPLQTVSKEADVKVGTLQPSNSRTIESNEPILPLPMPLDQKPNGVPYNYRNNRGRGRGRGNGYSRPVTKFTEDFDFIAMNEKFKKDEVWDHLGKKVQLKGQGEVDEIYDYEYDEQEEDTRSSKTERKAVYVEDDFFDTLSCNALDQGRNGKTKYSEQMKRDTETFGDFPRHHPNWGGRGFRGGRTRGSYYGRGYASRSRGPPNRYLERPV